MPRWEFDRCIIEFGIATIQINEAQYWVNIQIFATMTLTLFALFLMSLSLMQEIPAAIFAVFGVFVLLIVSTIYMVISFKQAKHILENARSEIADQIEMFQKRYGQSSGDED